MAAQIKELPQPTAYDLAEMALSDCNNDKEAAAALMLTWVLEDADATRAMCERGCNHFVNKAMTEQRRGVWEGTNRGANKQEPTTDGLKLLAGSNMRSLLDYPLHDGTLLRDATQSLIAKDADRNIQHGTTYSRRGRWLHLIAEHLPDDTKTVEQVLTIKDLEDLRKKVEEPDTTTTDS